MVCLYPQIVNLFPAEDLRVNYSSNRFAAKEIEKI